jgi:hypothetical protein
MRAAALLLAGLALSGCGELGVEATGADNPGPPEVTQPDEQVATASAGDPATPDPDVAALPVPRLPGGPPAGEAAAEAGTGAADAGAVAAAPSQAAATAPHIYMAVQPDRSGPVSVVFAIDRSRDNTPSDEPAIRITPDQTDPDRGRCNPQQLRYFDFPQESAERPVYGPDEAARGIGARDLPGFMATTVSQEMIVRGIAEELEQTRPQNVCTRKLFEQTIIAANTGQG